MHIFVLYAHNEELILKNHSRFSLIWRSHALRDQLGEERDTRAVLGNL